VTELRQSAAQQERFDNLDHEMKNNGTTAIFRQSRYTQYPHRAGICCYRV
jgi:hypothetical protein